MYQLAQISHCYGDTMVLVALLLVLLFIVVIFFYMGMLLWMLFSPDYLLVIVFSGIFTADHMGWLTSSEKAHFIWAVLAMVVAGFVYHKLNHLLYSVSQRIYAIVSFPIVVVSSLILMLNFALKLAEKVAPNLADDPTIEHAIYIVFAIIIAVFAWRKRQTAMARLHSPANIVLTNGNVMVVESSSAMPTSPYTPQAPTVAPAPGPAPLHTPPTTFSAQPGANSGPKKY